MSNVYTSISHPLRVALAAEVHSRPPLDLIGTESVTHLAVYLNDGDGSATADAGATQHGLLLALCAHFGVAGPVKGAKYFFHDFNCVRLKWECHTEFATFTFSQVPPAVSGLEAAFDSVPLIHIPQEWIQSIQGRIMVASHVVIDRRAGSRAASPEEIRRAFEGKLVVGSQVLEGAAEVWTDFCIQADGFSRFVLRDTGLRDLQPGRLVQRLLEIETYRMMAVLGLPHAQAATPVLNAIESELVQLTAAMTERHEEEGSGAHDEREPALLREITALAARIEKLTLETSYRFSASQAYFRLVRARIAELREHRLDGVPTISEFMERRLAPAMSTCESVEARQQALAERIGYTNDLLRTRVGIVQEHQNRKILQSMNLRAAQQLRLQQAVEGLSVVAISYYLAGLCNYVAKAMKSSGWPVNPDLVTGLLIPVIAVAVWLGLRRVHKSVHQIKARREAQSRKADSGMEAGTAGSEPQQG